MIKKLRNQPCAQKWEQEEKKKYIHTVRDYRQLQRCRYSTHFQFTVAHALGLLGFSSRILATDLSQSHCNFKSHMMSSLHRLIPFLPFTLNHLGLPSAELDPILSTTGLYSVVLGFFCCTLLVLCYYFSCRAEQSSSLLPATSQHGHSRHRAPLRPMTIYLFSVKTFVVFSFFLCSSFDKKGRVGLFYNWCSLTTPYSTRGHIKVGDISLHSSRAELLLRSCQTLLITTLHGPHGKHRLLLSRMRVYWPVT
jgi:hypothetical protein